MSITVSITEKVLQQRTNAYRAWVDSYARNHKVPAVRAKKGVSKEEHVRRYLQQMERQNRYGVYFIFRSMAVLQTCAAQVSHRRSELPHHQARLETVHAFVLLHAGWGAGPIAMCVGTYLPFLTTYYLNGHHYIENKLKRAQVAYRKNDNAFLWVADPAALQAAADSLSAEIVQKRLDCWTFLVGPKFSEKERAAIHLHRQYSINQVEYCRNSIFDHGHHVLRAYAKDAVARIYEKFSTFLRVEVCVNRPKDPGLNKGLENLNRLRKILVGVTDRFANFEASALNVMCMWSFHCFNSWRCRL